MRLLIAWIILVVAGLASHFLLPLAIDAWATDIASKDDGSSIGVGSVFADSFTPVFIFVAKWALPLMLLVLGLKSTVDFLVRQKR